jgi:hypothetical protein
VLTRFGFGDRWGFYDGERKEWIGMDAARCRALIGDADAVVNLCGATYPREEHRKSRCLVYLETDPGEMQAGLASGDARAIERAAAYHHFFTYAYNLGAPDCRLPATGARWHPTRPPVLLDEWRDRVGPALPLAFSTVGTWENKGGDVELDGEVYHWSKHLNFRQVLDVPRRADQPIELATDLVSGPDYDRALAGGFSLLPVIPMSLDIGQYRHYISASRGEFTVAKDLYVRTGSGWFSDRTACYLAAGRPVVTQRTGFEKYIPEGIGLLGFDDADEAVEAIRTINADYQRHARAAREIACEYFEAKKLLEEVAMIIGL